VESCIFCKIIAGDIPCEKVYEDDRFFAFRDINPKAPSHFLVIPKEHLPGVAELANNPELLGELMTLSVRLAHAEGLTDSGYRLVINQGEDGGQSVAHLHVHILGGRALSWPPG